MARGAPVLLGVISSSASSVQQPLEQVVCSGWLPPAAGAASSGGEPAEEAVVGADGGINDALLPELCKLRWCVLRMAPCVWAALRAMRAECIRVCSRQWHRSRVCALSLTPESGDLANASNSGPRDLRTRSTDGDSSGDVPAS